MPKLLLASTSPYRKALLERLGLPFDTAAPTCDEEMLKQDREDPVELAQYLADAKAASLQEVWPGHQILGGDQLVACDGQILGKPGSKERAVEQLLQMSGRSHQLVTAISLCVGESVHRHCDITTLTMRPLDRAACERYVAADEPVDCAGAYKLEARGICLFERIDSADHSAITGLPLIALTSLLRRHGWAIP